MEKAVFLVRVQETARREKQAQVTLPNNHTNNHKDTVTVDSAVHKDTPRDIHKDTHKNNHTNNPEVHRDDNKRIGDDEDDVSQNVQSLIAMMNYCSRKECRRHAILNYFGEYLHPQKTSETTKAIVNHSAYENSPIGSISNAMLGVDKKGMNCGGCDYCLAMKDAYFHGSPKEMNNEHQLTDDKQSHTKEPTKETSKEMTKNASMNAAFTTAASLLKTQNNNSTIEPNASNRLTQRQTASMLR